MIKGDGALEYLDAIIKGPYGAADCKGLNLGVRGLVKLRYDYCQNGRKFSDAQMHYLFGVVKKKYESFCEKKGIEPVKPPKSLVNKNEKRKLTRSL